MHHFLKRKMSHGSKAKKLSEWSSSWWLNQPSEKYAQAKLENLSLIFGLWKCKKYLRFHHLDFRMIPNSTLSMAVNVTNPTFGDQVLSLCWTPIWKICVKFGSFPKLHHHVIQAVTFWSPNVEGHQQPLEFGSRELTIPKRARKRRIFQAPNPTPLHFSHLPTHSECFQNQIWFLDQGNPNYTPQNYTPPGIRG